MPFLPKVQRLNALKKATPPRPLSSVVAKTLDTFERLAQPLADRSVPTIEVHDTVSQVAWVYEKLRHAIDYQDEHLLRKNTIERILRRRLVTGVTAEQVAEPLVLELIRGRYLPNKTIPTTTVDRLADVIGRYITLWSYVPTVPDPRSANRLFDWYLGVMAAHLNDILTPDSHDEALVRLMFNTVSRDIRFAAEEINDKEKDALLYIAIHRALLKSDVNIIRYRLFLGWHPEWQAPTPEQVAKIGQKLPLLRDRVENQLLHPSGDLLLRLMKKYAIIFLIFDDIAQKYGGEAKLKMIDPDTLLEDVKEAYAHRRKIVTNKIARNVIRSIIYVFLTKMLLLLLIEMPVDRLLAAGQAVSYFPLIFSATVPPLIILFFGVTIGPPGKKNEAGVVEKVDALVYRGDESNALVKPRKPIRRSAFFTALYRLIYALTFIVVFGAIIWGLAQIDFTPLSTFIFILFLTIVSFFGIRVRLYAKELVVVDQRENIFTVLFDFFTVPILQVGRWISLRAPKVNVLIFFLDVIIEAPFKAFLEAMEGFFGFLREKREEIY